MGRLRLTKRLHDDNSFSLSVGAGNTRFATVNVDVVYNKNLDIVADTFNLPFQNGVFNSVLFCDILEHLPKGKEKEALLEIRRVINGCLLLTTPNNIPIFTYLDPAYYQVGHRHYDIDYVKTLLIESGFELQSIFASGGMWHMIYLLFRYLIYFRLKRIFRTSSDFTPKKLILKVDEQYNYKTDGGYVIFAKATANTQSTDIHDNL